MKHLALSALALFTSAHLMAQSWQSSLVSMDADGCLTYTADEENNRIPDYSFAGYKNGESAIPAVPTEVIISPISGDNTDHIQQAIDQVAAMPLVDGIRGAVLLTAGTYPVSGSIYVNAAGVVLRGEGDGEDDQSNTIIFATGNTPNQRDVIIAGGGNQSEYWKAKVGSNVDIVSSFVGVGDFTFEVADASSFEVGDNIIIYHPCSSGWLDAIDGGGAPTEGSWNVDQYPIVFNRYIKAIDGNNITIDVPVYNHLDRSLSQSYIYKYDNPDLLTNIGIEDLRLTIETASETDENHAKNGIVFYEAEDGWATNCTVEHFIFSGFRIKSSARITVDQCSAIDPACLVEPSRRYNFNAAQGANNILFSNCYASYGRHAYTSNGTTWVSGIVVYNSESEHPYTSSEGHRHWTTGMLFDNFRDYGDNPGKRVLGFYNRGDYGTRHGWSNAHCVAWNCNLSRSSGTNGQAVIQKPPTAQNYAIGCFGDITGNGPFDGPTGWIEGTGQPGLEPSSLYQAQLNCRLGGDAPEPSTCQSARASEHDGNEPENVLDGDLDTRWSAQGDEQWIEFCFDLDSVALKGAHIAFYNGDQRQSYFDLQGTINDSVWFDIATDLSSAGNSLLSEAFDFDPTWVKKLRYLGHGNSVNDWNSVTEFSWDTAHIAYGTGHVIPGIIESEDYNVGGQQYSYYDDTPGNEGGDYRSDDVDVEVASEHDYNIGWTTAGEWWRYTVDVTSDGYYDFDFRSAAKNAPGEIELLVDEASAGFVILPQTDDYQVYETAQLSNVYLEQGEHVLTVKVITAGINLNYMEVSPSVITAHPEIGRKTWSVYPNPAHGTLYFSGAVTNKTFTISDASGSVIQQGVVAGKSVDIGQLPAGFFIIRMDGVNQRFVVR